MPIPEELVELFEKLARAEAEYAAELRATAERVKHPVLKALILGVALDSEKHSKFYEALVALARGSPVLTEEELEVIRTGFKEHVEEEAKDHKMVREILEKYGDKLDARAKLLLTAILEDEAAHHKLFEAIYEKVAKSEVVSEEEFWESVWMDAPYHGAPGG